MVHFTPQEILSPRSCIGMAPFCPCRLWLAFAAIVWFQPAKAQVAPADRAWMFAGPPPIQSGAGGSIRVPAGGELFRSVHADTVSLRISSQPFFGTEPETWPSIEVGAASLTFVREPDGGIVFLLGDRLVQPAKAVTLDADGRSLIPLDLTLSFDRTRNLGTLSLLGCTYAVPAGAGQGPIEVALSTGTNAAWNIDALELRSGDSAVSDVAEVPGETRSNVEVPGGREEPRDPPKSPDELRNDRRHASIGRARDLFGKGKEDEAEKALSENNWSRKDTARWHLETANELVHLAFTFARAGEADRAVQLARRALRQLELAGLKTEEPALSAAADETAAMIHERLLADPTNAKQRYRAAAQRYAAGGAARELERLERIEAEAGRRTGRPQGEGKP